MFLADLSTPNKKTLLGLVRTMIAADGVFAPEETEMLNDVVAELGLGDENGPTPNTIEEMCAGVTERDARAFMLLELASIAHVDGEYADQERDLLHDIAARWSIDAISLIRVEGWAAKRIELSREAAEVIHEIAFGGDES